MKTYALCGSMRFEKEMQRVAYDLETQKGLTILQCVYTAAGTEPTAEELQALERAHYQKIDISDGIYVLNIDGYIGASVRKEIDYALLHGKEVIYHCTK
ncbi:MAG: hypothetical protein IJO10_06395 [Clostridia bacterium]|nr:hypothetical protein [Clostridia bacterium]